MASAEDNREVTARFHIALHGAVQGVGFRPFVYRLATEMGLNGWVLNSPQGVFIEAEGERSSLEKFVSRIQSEKPPRSFIQGIETSILEPAGFTCFEVRTSDTAGAKSTIVLPDVASCPECVKETFDPANRRYLYPFTNCTNCGPRFSIIKALPYDRPNTTMGRFVMCDECSREYHDPSNRRFHAQPNACPKCGPRLELWNKDGEVIAMRHDALLEGAAAIRAGAIVALKGIGGFQLIADARSDDAVKQLRARKHREEKPFALMFPDIDLLKGVCQISPEEENLLVSFEAPIVILKRKIESATLYENLVCGSVAPGNPNLGAMLPYSPLHHILLRELGFPVVATSGNMSEEPICIDETEAIVKLGALADLFLVHDRPIERHVDDSIVRVVLGRSQVLRRARGYAPFPIDLEIESSEPILAVGGHLKNSVALCLGKNVFVSQHIGDLSTEESTVAFRKVVSDLERMFEVSPKIAAHDAHPDYVSTQFAESLVSEKVSVQHHVAHVAGCMAENRIEGSALGVSWDGTGYGDDGTIWGGEFFVTKENQWSRGGTLYPFKLPGNEAAVREPRRSAIGVLFEIFGEKLKELHLPATIRSFSTNELNNIVKMLATGFNSPVTSSVGRIFDAVASLTGLRQVLNFEGQGAMELEFSIDGTTSDDSYPMSIISRASDSLLIVDWREMIAAIVEDVAAGVCAGLISIRFHNSLSNIVVQMAERVGEHRVVLSGGCFQNRYLLERTVRLLTENGFTAYWNQRVPPNDGGISFGQAAYAMKKSSTRSHRDSLVAASHQRSFAKS